MKTSGYSRSPSVCSIEARRSSAILATASRTNTLSFQPAEEAPHLSIASSSALNSGCSVNLTPPSIDLAVGDASVYPCTTGAKHDRASGRSGSQPSVRHPINIFI